MTKNCYATLCVLRKIKRHTSLPIRKQLAKSIILSKLDYCNEFLHFMNHYEQQLQKVQNAAAGLVLNKYPNINDATNIKWLPIEEGIEYSLAMTTVKAICDENVPNHLKLPQKLATTRNLRSNNKGILIDANQKSKTFKKETRDIFNKLPTNIPSVETLSVFKIKVRNHFLDQVLARSFKDEIYVIELYFSKISKQTQKR